MGEETGTRELRRAEAAEARAEEREARDALANELRAQLKAERAEKEAITNRYTSLVRWFLLMGAVFCLLLLLFVGALVGVVQAGNVNVPGIGTVTVGNKAPAPEAP